MRTIRLLLFPILIAVLTTVTAGATITFEDSTTVKISNY